VANDHFGFVPGKQVVSEEQRKRAAGKREERKNLISINIYRVSGIADGLRTR
jgi:hypothetical protein